MNYQKTDVLIVGGGIAGLTVAKYLAEAGVDFILLEDHMEFGLKCCGEGITYSLIGHKFYDIYGSKRGIEKETKNIILRTKYGDITLPVSNIITNKKKVEEEIAKQARKNGANIIMGEKVSNIEKMGKNVVAFPQNFVAKVVVGADGVHSVVREYTGQKIPKYGIAATGILREKPKECDSCIIDFSKKIAPYGYAWWFPKKSTFNIGIGTVRKNNFRYTFSKFRGKYSQVKMWRVGIVPVSKPLKSYDKNIMLVGDSAAQVVAVLADGILPSMICAKICSETIIKFSRSNFKNIDTSLYEKTWKEQIGKIFYDGYLAYNILLKLYWSEYLTNQYLKLLVKIYKE